MEPDAIPQRYRPTYRADEASLILSFALRGESLGFVGAAGVGKSNLVNFLRDGEAIDRLAGRDMERLHFPIVDATLWQGTATSLWSMMIDALNQSTQELGTFSEGSKVIPFSEEAEEEQLWHTLRARLQWICQELKHQVMYVLDDFDAVFQSGSVAMLERLNGLRSEGNRNALSYLVFTKQLPHVLGRAHNLEGKSKFYDLFRHNLYALEPYTPEDARQMLTFLNEVAGKPVSSKDLAQILSLAGGHAQLLKILFNICINEGMPSVDVIGHFAGKPDVQQECQRILRNLHVQERQAALRLARGQHIAEDRAALDHLMRRGLLVRLAPAAWFSPLMDRFLITFNE